MPSSTELAGQIRFPICHRIQPGATQSLEAPYYVAGALVAPSSATLSLQDAGGATILDEVSASITGSVATYSYAAPSTLVYGEGWTAEWKLTVSGSVYQAENDAIIVRRRLYCPISDLDLYRVAPSLDPSGAAPVTSDSNFGSYIKEAWTSIQHRLIEYGRRPDLISSPSSLREVAIHTTLANIWRAQAHRLNPAFAESAKTHQELADAAWRRWSPKFDDGNSGTASSGRKGRSAALWVTS